MNHSGVNPTPVASLLLATVILLGYAETGTTDGSAVVIETAHVVVPLPAADPGSAAASGVAGTTAPTTAIVAPPPASSGPATASPAEAAAAARPFAIALALSVLLKGFLALLRRRTSMLKGHDHRRALLIATGVGAVVFALDTFAMGTPWVESIFGAGGVLGGPILDLVFPPPYPGTTSTETPPPAPVP